MTMNGSYFLLYTVEEGATFKVMKFPKAGFEGIVKSGSFSVYDVASDETVHIQPKFVALVKVVENYDFINKAPRT